MFKSKRLRKKHLVSFGVLVVILLIVLLGSVLYGSNFAVLNPKGVVAQKQFHLLIFAVVLSLIIVIPVLTMTFVIAWKYRESNTKAHYSPDWDHNIVAETAWWLIPLALITVLSVVAWNSSHDLSPTKPLFSNAKPMTIQVIALQWKWLFIYPEQNIATINFVEFPVHRPINFEITSDAPMNSFWIPQLGGQIYAMSGMTTRIQLMADQVGSFVGRSANISGEGFSNMNFTAQSDEATGFSEWLRSIKSSPNSLTQDAYNALAVPSSTFPVPYFSSTESNIFQNTVYKYLDPGYNIPSTPYISPHQGHGI